MAASTPSSSSVAAAPAPSASALATSPLPDSSAIPSLAGGGVPSTHPRSSHFRHPPPPSHPAQYPAVQLYSSSSSLSAAHSSAGELSSNSHHIQQHSYNYAHLRSQQQQQRVSSSLGQRQHHSHTSLPADSFPRTLSRETAFDQGTQYHQPPSPSSLTQPSSLRRHYQLHQSTYPPAFSSSSSNHFNHSQPYEDATASSNSNISSNLPEYSYPITPSQRQHRDHHRSLQPEHHNHHHQQHEHRLGFPQQKQGHPQVFQSQGPYPLSKRLHLEPPEQQDPLYLRMPLPPPILTQRKDDASRMRSAESRVSPATPRSGPLPSYLMHPLTSDLNQLTESPIDFREPSSFRHGEVGVFRSMYDLAERETENDMEHCSERDDVREREYDDEDEGEEEEEVEDDDGAFAGHVKKQKLIPSDSRGKSASVRRNSKGEEREEDGDGEEVGGSGMVSRSDRYGQGVSQDSVDGRPPSKSRKSRSIPARKRPRRSSLMTSIGDTIDQIEEEAQAAAGVQSLAGRGLRIYAQLVCERVQARGLTNYNELVGELFGPVPGVSPPGPPGENAAEAPEDKGQENIRRRVYDALNVLEALGIISFDNKDITWVGIAQSTVIRDVTRHQAAVALVQGGLPPGDGGDEESEEPEDDDMDIEKLERENEALALKNELEMAQLQDQLTRHVQVVNLVKRNKRREAKEEEREERRRKRKEEKHARAMAIDQDPSMTDVGPQGVSDHNEEAARKLERHRRRRSLRHSSKRPEGPEGEARPDGMEEGQEDEDEEARQRRKKDRGKRRKLKLERIQLPLVTVRMSGYASQSSDSESNISVVRRKRHCESTGQENATVEIQIPQQDDLSVISDTEILGDLGFNTLTLDELKILVPDDLINYIRCTVNSEDVQHRRQRSPHHQRRVAEPTSTGDDSAMEVDGVAASRSVTVQGGFEREIVRMASGDNYNSVA